MSTCKICNKSKGKRSCFVNGDELICPVCCANTRNSDCFGCDFYKQAEKFEETKKEKKEAKTFVAELNDTLDHQVDDILALVEEGRFEDAEPKMKALHQRNPNYHSTNYGMGVVYLFQNNEDLALPYFERAVKILPIFADAWYNIAIIHKNRGDIVEMIKALNMHQQYAEKGTREEKVAHKLLSDLSKGIKKNEGVDIDTYVRMSEIYKDALDKMDRKRFIEARNGFLKMVDVMPNHYQSWGNLGLCHGYLGDKESAIKCLEKAIKINHKYTPAIQNLEGFKRLSAEEIKNLPFVETVFKG